VSPVQDTLGPSAAQPDTVMIAPLHALKPQIA